MKVKTAMQEMIEIIEGQQSNMIELARNDKTKKKEVDAILTTSTVLKMMAKKLLEKEKKQIIDSYDHDLYGGIKGERKFQNGKEYFEESYTSSPIQTCA